jgi:hypothetical protein
VNSPLHFQTATLPAKRHLALSRETIMTLANSLPQQDPLGQTFLSAPMIRKILGDRETPSVVSSN